MYIYIHIPFCTHICSYCDFAKIYYNKDIVNKYLKSLEQEIKKRYKNELVKTIYIGGGTPTSLDLEELRRLLEIIKIFNKDKNIEFTIESNIELDINKIKLLKEYNVNRISLGVQSFDDKVLKLLNRTHHKDDIFNTINLLKKEGINNINIDLIYGVIDDLNIVKNDIDTFLKLDIPHISCYSLILEKNTMLYNNNFKPINEDNEYEMYKLIEDILTKNNYIHYEISNYAKPNYKSIHNINYWHNGSYYGFGLNAVSYLNNYRITNTKNISKYLENNYLKDKIHEDEYTQMQTDLMLNLRLLEGINYEDFYQKYNKNIEEIFDIDYYLEKNILIKKDNHLKINKNYIYLSNEILVNMQK